MDLDRQTIEKKDFPIGRRGYEPEAVDGHLRDVADEVDQLRRSARAKRGTESLASAASAQVQAIVEAAETTASDIERQAQMEAQRIRQEADRAAERTRGEAVERAQAHVQAVSQATSMMLQRVDAMESELGALIESLRTGANRLTADLTLLEGNMSELYDAAGRRGTSAAAGPPVAAPAPAAAPGPLELDEEPDIELEERELLEAETELVVEAAVIAEAEAELEAAEREIVDEVEEIEERRAALHEQRAEDVPLQEAIETAEAPAGADESVSGDVDGARLIALNMALNGQSRAEADRYLAENFDLPDRAGLLDEVFAAVEG